MIERRFFFCFRAAVPSLEPFALPVRSVRSVSASCVRGPVWHRRWRGALVVVGGGGFILILVNTSAHTFIAFRKIGSARAIFLGVIVSSWMG